MSEDISELTIDSESSKEEIISLLKEKFKVEFYFYEKKRRRNPPLFSTIPSEELAPKPFRRIFPGGATQYFRDLNKHFGKEFITVLHDGSLSAKEYEEFKIRERNFVLLNKEEIFNTIRSGREAPYFSIYAATGVWGKIVDKIPALGKLMGEKTEKESAKAAPKPINIKGLVSSLKDRILGKDDYKKIKERLAQQLSVGSNKPFEEFIVLLEEIPNDDLLSFLAEKFSRTANEKEIENLKRNLILMIKSRTNIEEKLGKIVVFEKMVKTDNTLEDALRDYLLANPWILGEEYVGAIRKEVEIEHGGHKHIPDLVLKNIFNIEEDIVELKRADVPLLKNDSRLKDEKAPRAVFLDVIWQSIRYVEVMLAQGKYPKVYILIGRHEPKDEEIRQILRKLSFHLPNIEILTYTEIIERARKRIESYSK